jgi:beta-lactamase class A
MEPAHLGRGQQTRGPRGIEARTPQDLVSQQVADASHAGLIQEPRLEGSRAPPQGSAEVVHTALVLDAMERITTGDRRIKAGLPAGVSFAQKTGTQISRACNVGVVHPREDHRGTRTTPIG